MDMAISSSISAAHWLQRDHAITSREGVTNTKPPTEHSYDAITAFHGSDDESVHLPRFDGTDGSYASSASCYGLDDLNEHDSLFDYCIGAP